MTAWQVFKPTPAAAPAAQAQTESLYERDNLLRLQGTERIYLFLQPFIATFGSLQLSNEAFLSGSVFGVTPVQNRLHAAPSTHNLEVQDNEDHTGQITMAQFMSKCLELLEQAYQLKQHIGTANGERSKQGRDLAISSAFEKGFQVMSLYREVSDVLSQASINSELINLRTGLNLSNTTIRDEIERMYTPIRPAEAGNVAQYHLRLPAESTRLQSQGVGGVWNRRIQSNIAGEGSANTTMSFRLVSPCPLNVVSYLSCTVVPQFLVNGVVYEYGPYCVIHWDERFREEGSCNRAVCVKDRVLLKRVSDGHLLGRVKKGNKYEVGDGVGSGGANNVWVITRAI